MAILRLGAALALIFVAFAAAAEPQPAGLYDRPVLVIEPGMHTSIIRRADTDAAGTWVVTGSDDKTVRVWSVADGQLQRTIRLPAGPGNVGKVYSVAISPDGKLIAAGGWTRWSTADPHEQIYIFDRASGQLVKRIEGLPSTLNRLAFSKDGASLAATLWGTSGLRVYQRDSDWSEIAHDPEYGGDSYGLAFSADGRIATTSYDGKLRLYDGPIVGDIRPSAMVSLQGGKQPCDVAFDASGARLAVGYDDTTALEIRDGRTLAPLENPDLKDISNGNLRGVGWSDDGQTLFAGGRYYAAGKKLLALTVGGDNGHRVLRSSDDTIMSLSPLSGGDLLVAAADPWLARLHPDGAVVWSQRQRQADFRANDTLPVSNDGVRVGFGFSVWDQTPARFDLATRLLTLGPPTPDMQPADRSRLQVQDWFNSDSPNLAGQKLPLTDNVELSWSLAVHPAGDRFVLGAGYSLNAFDATGKRLWQRPVPGATWGVNITGDGRLVVAAYADGTIRWHRMSDGVELLAFMPLPDQINWVAWTPEGFYAATPGARGVLRWQVNHGWDKPAETIPIENIKGAYRPELLPLVLQELETPRALGRAELAAYNKEVALRTHSDVPPGAQLHLLTIGISDYNEDYAKKLRLRFADRDALDLANALVESQASLYAKVNPQMLQNKAASKGGIIRALHVMRNAMAAGEGNDLAVIHFSGHGAVIDKTLYLLPYDVDASDSDGIKTTGLSVDDLRSELVELAKHGRVLVLLDACHAGAATADGVAINMDSTALRTELAGPNVTVITSSSGHSVSREDPAWQHGAFTKALLDSLVDPKADPDHTGFIGANALAHYLSDHVKAMTDEKQIPDMEVRYDTTVFAAGL